MMKKIITTAATVVMAVMSVFADYSTKLEIPACDYTVLNFEGKQYQMSEYTLRSLSSKDRKAVEEGCTTYHFDAITQIVTYHGDTSAMEAFSEEMKDSKKVMKMSAEEIQEKSQAASKGITGATHTIIVNGETVGKEVLDGYNQAMMALNRLPIADAKVLKNYLKANR